ncbi:MAG: PrsW family glutamic-type intramembrane protease [Saprospiraceae bacterium]
MANIHFFCMYCRHPLEIDEALGGQQMECPHCTGVVPIPFAKPKIVEVTEETQTETSTKKNTPANLFETGSQQAKVIFNDLKSIRFSEEVLPIDGNNALLLAKDFVFWAVTLLGIIPLLIVTVEDGYAQLTMFALFFAAVWGVIFKRFILNDAGSLKWPVAALFFSGIVGIWLLLLVYRLILPDFYLHLADSKNSMVSLFGFVFQVGIWEEMFKAIPLVIFLKMNNQKLDPLHLVTIGVFSGLGFAAFENLHYGDNAVASAYSLTRDYGVTGLVSGVQNAMVLTMLRAVSLVFCHGVFSGIVAYFVATAMMRKERVGALIVLGVGVAAVLHGLYDWLAGIQPTIAALLAGFSFALFYGYLSKLRSMGELYEMEEAD